MHNSKKKGMGVFGHPFFLCRFRTPKNKCFKARRSITAGRNDLVFENFPRTARWHSPVGNCTFIRKFHYLAAPPLRGGPAIRYNLFAGSRFTQDPGNSGKKDFRSYPWLNEVHEKSAVLRNSTGSVSSSANLTYRRDWNNP